MFSSQYTAAPTMSNSTAPAHCFAPREDWENALCTVFGVLAMLVVLWDHHLLLNKTYYAFGK
jgi:hypothetical protein